MGGRGSAGARNSGSGGSAAKTFNSEEELNEFFSDQGYLDTEAVEMYTDMGMRFNADLRNGGMFVKEWTEGMDRSIASQELKQDITVFRAGSNALLGFDDEASITQAQLKANGLIGATVTDKGFVSTTALKSDLLGDSLGYKLESNAPIYRIKVKAGKGKGAYVESKSVFKGQHEFVIKRGSSFKVIGASKDSQSGRTIIDLEI